MLDELSWETLKSRRIKLQLTNLYKIQHNLIDLEASKYLTKRSTTVRSKHSSQLNLYLWSKSQAYVCEILDSPLSACRLSLDS